MKNLIISLQEAETNATSFLLVRHGETDWNVLRRCQGHTDIPLNETGKAQAAKLREHLYEVSFDICLSSDLMRAKETASILTNLEIRVDPRLRERFFGKFEGMPYGFSSKGAEQEVEHPSTLSSRIFGCLEETSKAHPNKKVLVATHGDVIKQVLIDLLFLTCDRHEVVASNASTLHIIYSEGKWRVKNFTGMTIPSLSDNF